jgi:hypothetical protein
VLQAVQQSLLGANAQQPDLTKPAAEGAMPDQTAPEYKEADSGTGPTQLNTPRARAGVTGHNVRYVLGFSLIAVIIAFVIVYISYFHHR